MFDLSSIASSTSAVGAFAIMLLWLTKKFIPNLMKTNEESQKQHLLVFEKSLDKQRTTFNDSLKEQRDSNQKMIEQLQHHYKEQLTSERDFRRSVCKNVAV